MKNVLSALVIAGLFGLAACDGGSNTQDNMSTTTTEAMTAAEETTTDETTAAVDMSLPINNPQRAEGYECDHQMADAFADKAPSAAQIATMETLGNDDSQNYTISDFDTNGTREGRPFMVLTVDGVDPNAIRVDFFNNGEGGTTVVLSQDIADCADSEGMGKVTGAVEAAAD